MNGKFSEFSLMDYHARFYSPAIGKFTQPDSIIPDMTNSQGWNRYAYVLNSPVMYMDPSGHIAEGACGFGGGDSGINCDLSESPSDIVMDKEKQLCAHCHVSKPNNKLYKNYETFFPGGFFPEFPTDLSGYNYETENLAPLVPGAQPIFPYIPNKVTGTYYGGTLADLTKDLLQYVVANKWAKSEKPLNVLIVFEFSLNENSMASNLPSNGSVTVHNVAVANLSGTGFRINVGQRDGVDLFSGFVRAGELKQFSVNQDVGLSSEILIGMNNAGARIWWADSTNLP